MDTLLELEILPGRSHRIIRRWLDGVRAIAQQVQAVSQNMDAIATQIQHLADGPGVGSVPNIARNVRLILAWSVVLHLLILGFAISFYILATALRRMTYDAPRIWGRAGVAEREATGP